MTQSQSKWRTAKQAKAQVLAEWREKIRRQAIRALKRRGSPMTSHQLANRLGLSPRALPHLLRNSSVRAAYRDGHRRGDTYVSNKPRVVYMLACHCEGDD